MKKAILLGLVFLSACSTTKRVCVRPPEQTKTAVVTRVVLLKDSTFRTYAKSGKEFYYAVLKRRWNKGDTLVMCLNQSAQGPEVFRYARPTGW